MAPLLKSLAVLRERLPHATQLWIGGAGASKVRARGVTTLSALEEIGPAVAAWRSARIDLAQPGNSRSASRL